MLFLILLAAIALTFYYFCVRPIYYWKNLGVSQGSPTWLFGDNFRTMLGVEGFITTIDKEYKRYAHDKRYFGMYVFVKPMLVIKDPDLIKDVTVRAFDNFADHRVIMPAEADPLWGKNLVELKGEDWRYMRPLMSPSFTTGKIRAMYDLMSACAENFVQFFTDTNEKSTELDVRNAMMRYTNDVIASIAFGVTVDSMKNPNNEFFLTARRATDFNKFWPTLSALSAFVLPASLMKMFGFRFFGDDIREYFFGVLEDSLRMRKNSGTFRSDLIDSLLEAQSTAKKDDAKRQMTDDDILAQAMIFFLGGFDTVTKLISFMCYELAINKEVQDRLREEIVDTYRDHNGKITYDVLMKMEYLEMVLSESLRKWPVMGGIDRMCTKSYKVDPTSPDEQPLILEKGATIWIPVWSMHRDPKFFPEPEKFDPERFSEENKKGIPAYAYNPFGFGPRSCIGARFSLLKCKIFILHLLSKFELEPCSKTKIPMNLLPKAFLVNPEVDIILNMKRRSQ